MRKLQFKLWLLTLLIVVGGVNLNAQEAGTYYIQNVGTGKWLGAGNAWGTQASVLEHADYWKLAKINDGVYTLESVASNGGTNYYLTGTYCDGGKTNFTFTPIDGKDNVYSIHNTSNGYLTTDGTIVDVSAANGSDEAAQWKLYSESDMSAVMSAATIESPADATFLIKDHNFNRNNCDRSSWTIKDAVWSTTGKDGAARYSIEAYKKTFDVHQDLTNIPNGVYAVRVNGFYRQDGNDAKFPYVYGNDRKTPLLQRTGTENNMQEAAVSFEAGKYLSEPAYVQVTDGKLTVGVATEGATCWSIFKNFHLYYYGDVTLSEVVLYEYVILYKEALNAAKGYQDANMFEDDKDLLNAAITENTIDLTGEVTEEMLSNSTANLNAATATAAKAVVKKTAYDNIVTAIEGKTDVNITSYIANLGFEDSNLNSWTSTYGGNLATNTNFSGKVGSRFVERWQSANDKGLSNGSLTHDVIALPAGVYTITANAQNIEQYNNNAAGTGYFLCVNDKKKEIGAADTYKIAVKYIADYTNVTIQFLLDNCTGNWISCDDVQIVYNGDNFPPVTLATGKMNAAVAAAQDAAKAAYDADPDNADKYYDLVDAIAAAEASVAVYATVNEYFVKVGNFDEAGQNAFYSDEHASEVKTAYDNSTFETLDAETRENLDNALRKAALSQITAGANMTLALLNPSFEDDFTGWTNTGMAIQANTSFGKDGNKYAETWQPKGTFSVKQTVTLLNSGVYTISARTKARGVTSAKLFAADVNSAIAIADVENDSEVKFACDANQEVEFGFEGTGTGAGNSWLCVDNFRLTYEGVLPDVTSIEGKMNAEVAAAQAAAIEAYNNEKTVANYNAAQAAIAAAQASVNAYAKAKQAVDDANALRTAHNFASETAATTFAAAIAEIAEKYDDETLSDGDANNAGLTLGVSVSGWRANANAPAVVYLNDGFSLTAGDWDNPHVNTWSTEGNSDGSGFKVPFYEYWTADANSLASRTLTGTLTDMPNGLYTVKALVRVRAKNGTDVGEATGVTMNVTTGEAVDLTKGEQIGESQFLMKEYTAEGLVKDGRLTVNFSVAEDNNISWLSFKNVFYYKERDLTEEEKLVKPTAIALFNGENEVTDPIELTAASNTVTLTPKYTPADSSDGYINWTSSDAAVATVTDGVVTGVAPGTTTITATSMLDAEVSASVTVNVSYPESVIPATVEFIDGAKKIVYTLSEKNLFVNGSFEYVNGVYGWKTVNYTTNALASNFTINTTGGFDGGAYITTNGAGVGSEKTIRQSVAVEPGKQYYFAVYTSGKAPSAGNFQYNALFKMSDATTENGVLKEFEWPQGEGKTTSEWSKTEYVFTADEANPFVGVRMGWNESSKFDNFVLVEITAAEVTDLSATTEDYTALNAAIAASEEKTLGFDEGEYAPYTNTAALQVLAAAKSIDQTVDNLQNKVREATEALKAAVWTVNTEEMNAVYDGTFANAENDGAPAGWSMSNNTLGGALHSRAFVNDARLSEFNETNSAFFIRFDGTNSNRGSMYYYGNTEGYTMPLKEDTYYRVTVDFAGWGSTGKPLRMYVSGPEGFTAVDAQHNTEHNADKEEDYTPQQFNIFFKTTTAGNYVINFQTPGSDANKHNAIISNVVLKRAFEEITIDEGENYEIASTDRYGKVTFNRTLVEGWNGLVLPFDMTVEDVKTTFAAGKVKEFTDISYAEATGVTLNFADFAAETTVIPAGTPFMVKAAAGTGYVINEVLLPATGLKNIEKTAEGYDNIKYIMKGTYAAETDLTDVSFALINGTQFFYHYAGRNASSAKAFRAYFENVSTNPAAARVSFAFDDEGTTTAITEVSRPTAAEGTCYDLQGRKVDSMKQKGIYIVNGRKVVK